MKKVIIYSILIVFTACTATRLSTPTTDQLPTMQQKVPGITLARAEQGYTAYGQHCSGCHRLHAPSQFTSAKWDKILIEMFPKAKVKDASTQALITDYLHALSK